MKIEHLLCSSHNIDILLKPNAKTYQRNANLVFHILDNTPPTVHLFDFLKMIVILVFGFLMSIAAFASGKDSSSVAFEMIMQKYENAASLSTAQQARKTYKKQFYADPPVSGNDLIPYNHIFKEYQEISDSLMQKTAQIIHLSINELKQNVNGQYYVWDTNAQFWHLPQQAAPANPVDGAAINAGKLSKQIQDSLKKQLDLDNSMLVKRSLFSPSFFRGVAKSKTADVLHPDSIKLGWWRSVFGRARLKNEIRLFFYPNIVKVYFGIASVGYLYFICRDVFGKQSTSISEAGIGSIESSTEQINDSLSATALRS